MPKEAGEHTVGPFRDAIRAPWWWVKRQGASGPLAPVAVLFAFVLMSIASAAAFVADRRGRDAVIAAGAAVAAVVVDGWLVKQMRDARDVGS